jgi:hypothetical protein
MPTMALAIPNDLDEITEKSEFTENDAMQMDKKIKKSLRKHYEKEVS